MEFQSQVKSGVRVIELAGHWTGGHDDDDLRAALLEWVGEGDRLFVFDMSGVDLLNSIGLGRLVSYYTTLTREKGKISLAGLQERHRRAAYVARILDLFDDFDDVEQAVSTMARQAEG